MMYPKQHVRLPFYSSYLPEFRFDRSDITSISPSLRSDSSSSFLNFDGVCTAKRGVWCPAPVLVATVLLALLSFIVSNASVYYVSLGSCAHMTSNRSNRGAPAAAQSLTADSDKWLLKSPTRTQPSTTATTTTQHIPTEYHLSNDKHGSKSGKKVIDFGSPNDADFFRISLKPLSAVEKYSGSIVDNVFDNGADPSRVRLKVRDPIVTTVGSTSTSSPPSTTSKPHSEIVNRIFDMPQVHSSPNNRQQPSDGVFSISADIEPLASGDKSKDTKFDLVNFVFYKRTGNPSGSQSPFSPIKTTTTTTLAPITVKKTHQPLNVQPQLQPVIVVSNELAWQK